MLYHGEAGQVVLEPKRWRRVKADRDNMANLYAAALS